MGVRYLAKMQRVAAGNRRGKVSSFEGRGRRGQLDGSMAPDMSADRPIGSPEFSRP